jgi:hypothetical protein
MRLIIAGGRDFDDYTLLRNSLDHLLSNTKEPVEIVSGKAKGADSLGERYARERGHAIKEFPANWDLHGKKAGYIRNAEMAAYATHCVCFWDGSSRGTKMMIELAKEKGLLVRVIKYKTGGNL